MHNDRGRRISAVIRKSFIIGLVSFMPFSNSILAGETLVRNAEQSEGFQSGVTGWRIARNGDAEFNDAVIRGELIVGSAVSQHILISTDNVGSRPEIEWFSGSAGEVVPARMFSSGPADEPLELTIRSPLNDGAPVGSILPEINMASWDSVASTMNLWADEIRTNVPIRLLGNDTWTDIPLSGTWVDAAGARADYMKDGVGNVHLRGLVIGGGASTIGVMPVGYRPTQATERIMRGNGGVIMCAVLVDTNGVMSVTANLGTAQASGVRLDAFTYPTF